MSAPARTLAMGQDEAGNGRPKAIVLRTLPGKGIPTLETREKAHFVRVDADEWDQLAAELEAGAPGAGRG